MLRVLLSSMFGCLFMVTAAAEEVSVAVAANFTETAQDIAQQFAQQTGHKAVLSFGSTGQLYAQISQGAPYEVFLAADQERPMKAEAEGFAVMGSRFTYAIGQLVLWSINPDLVRGEDILTTGNFTKIAITNPETAPYGAAAVQTMQALGVYTKLEDKIVRGNNIAQVYQFIATENAELGFVALSQLADNGEGSRWLVPEDKHAPLRQDAVLLQYGAKNEAAQAFLEFLDSPAAQAIIAQYGYGIDR